MTFPFFSILIPAKGRPNYLTDAIESVLLQDFTDVEILVSNNGGDAALREVVARYQGDGRMRYVEQPVTLDMPAHWEKTSRELAGEYMLVLTDRSVLKAGALAELHRQIIQQPVQPDVISWPWDLYYDHLKIVSRYPALVKKMQILDSGTLLSEAASGIKSYPYSLPRGLNSCVRMRFVADMRTRYGEVFRPLTPDFTFAYLCLLNSKSIAYIDTPLFVSQGLKISNGGNSFAGDAAPYFDSLGLKETFAHVPFKLPLVQNAIHEDFLAMATLCGREDLLKAWNRKNYYLECLAEIDAKRGNGGMRRRHVDALDSALSGCLMGESEALQLEVGHARGMRSRFMSRIVGLMKRMLGSRIETMRRYLLLSRGRGVPCKTALEAAGFNTTNTK